MSTAPVRVLWLTKGLGLGGAERLLSVAATLIDRDRFHVELAYLLPWKDAFVERLRTQGVTVHCLNASRTTDLRWVLRLRRLMRAGGFALVHTHAPVPAVAARLCLEARTPIVHTEHNVWGRYQLPTRLANALTYGRSAHVFAVSDGVADSVRRSAWAPWLRLPPVQVLHHGIDETLVRRGADARADARRRLGLEATSEIVGTVANFTPKKDQRSLLEAVSGLVPSRPRLRLVLIGSGPLEATLRARADELGLADRVVFLGSRDDVQELLPAFDVFALSSLHEGLPISLLEAMAAGLASVATDVGGVGEALTDGREGFLVPSRDADALASALRKLLDDTALRDRMGRDAIVTAGHFSIASAVAATEQLYDTLLEAPASGGSR